MDFVVKAGVVHTTGSTQCTQLYMPWIIYEIQVKEAPTPPLVDVLFCSLAVLDPRAGHTMDVLSPFISVLCHSDWLFHGKYCPRLDVVHPGRAWSSSPACTWHCSLYYLLVSSWCDHSMLASLLWRSLTVPSILQLCSQLYLSLKPKWPCSDFGLRLKVKNLVSAKDKLKCPTQCLIRGLGKQRDMA